MTKHELGAKIARQIALETPDQAVAETEVVRIIDALTSTLREAVTKGSTVTVRQFGSFMPKRMIEKKARDIAKGTTVIIPAHRKPVFKPSPDFVDQVRTAPRTSTEVKR